ncbi:M35 family metallo-endopeptidase [Massilia sp. TWR1-2-2]|uniref:M35 family metallo-endopeptidase n=1 Tax=Massilia sp. TWR1-2-2 TaxID=2804584 RepID=UPI003CED7A90
MKSIFRASIAAFTLVVCASAQAASNGIAVSISTEKSSLGKSDDVVVTVTLTNTAASPQAVLKWHTPFGGEIEEPLFDIRRDGAKVPYLGARYKRPAPTAADYYVLAPGASRSARVELSSLYEMSVTGDYTIRYATESLTLFDPHVNGRGTVAQRFGELKSQPLTLFIDARLPRGAAGEPAPAPDAARGSGASLSFAKCSASQQSALTTAVTAGRAMADDGERYLMARKLLGPRYTNWFGASDPARLSTVRGNYAAIKDALATRPVTVDCSCNKPYFAYVYPTKPYVIHVCRAFWTAPMTGIDSKGGTLVHEMSHFNVVAGTDDWVYGQEGAAGLAIGDPARAVNNADSHEYFGENTPALE